LYVVYVSLCIRDTCFHFFLARHPPVGQGLLIHKIFLIAHNTLGSALLDE